MTSIVTTVENDFSVAIKGVGEFFEKIVAAAGSQSADAANTVSTSVTSAANTLASVAGLLETAVPAAATLALNYLLSLIPNGSTYDAIADSFLTELINQALSQQKTIQGS